MTPTSNLKGKFRRNLKQKKMEQIYSNSILGSKLLKKDLSRINEKNILIKNWKYKQKEDIAVFFYWYFKKNKKNMFSR